MLRKNWNLILCMLLVFGVGVAGCGDSGNDKAVCGNNIVEGDEECDGNDLNNMTCQSLGYTGGTLACTDNCEFDESGCTDEVELCGNGEIDPGEDCDGSNLDGETCEGLGFDGGELACSATCRFDTSACVDFTEGALGDACESDDDCKSGWCLTEMEAGLPSGYCVAECDPDDYSCPDDGLCMDLGMPVCLATCNPGGNDCRIGYSCFELDGGEGVCWGDCDNDNQCTETGYCDLDNGFCGCPPGTHLDRDIPDCVYDDCDYLACENLNMTCDPVGGCEGNCAVCDGCLDNDYVQSTNHCYPPGAHWGSECTKHSDCPGTGMPGVDTFCYSHTGGFCVQDNGPDFVAEGEPCAGDANSVGYILDLGMWGEYEVCEPACDDDNDCRPGYECVSGMGTQGDVSVCNAIDDCADKGCNDAGELYCSDAGSCWIDSCVSNPCIGLDNSTETCMNDRDAYKCECVADHLWNPEDLTCDEFICGADDLGTWDGTTIVRTGDSCDGTQIYGNVSLDCTGYSAPGQELVYSLAVPDGETITITQTPVSGNDQDSSLYILEECIDLDGLTCLEGSDDTFGGEAETLTWTNNTGDTKTIFIIADAFSGCGPIELTIE